MTQDPLKQLNLLALLSNAVAVESWVLQLLYIIIT